MMTIQDAVRSVFRNDAVFEGRARRPQDAGRSGW
jgi:hypothetical protein